MNTRLHHGWPRETFCFLLPLLMMGVGVPEASAQVGACCLGNGSCVPTDNSGCDTLAGEFLGAGTSCVGVDCNGACCLSGETCSEGSLDDCVAGDFQGVGSMCETHCAGALGSQITYQGQLKQNGAPLSGMIDLEASLWTAAIGGAQVGTSLLQSQVHVTNGLFTVNLDFGASALDGDKRWLELSVRSPHDPSDMQPFTLLNPRQAVTAAPHALFSSAPWQTTGTDISYSVGNVGIGTTEPDDRLHVRGTQPTLRLDDDGAPGSFSDIKDAGAIQLRINKTNISGSVLLDINPKVTDGTSDAQIRFFRETDTTGPKTVQFLRGNFTTAVSARIGVDGQNSFFQAHGGNFGIGTTNPIARLHVVGDGNGAVMRITNGGSGGTALVAGDVVGSGRAASFYGITSNTLVSITNDGSGPAATFGGNVGLGTSSPSFQLHLSQNSAYKPSSRYWSISSDERLKKNIHPIDHALDDLLRLRGVTFQWRDPEAQACVDGVYKGMIAQEIEKVFPEWIGEGADGYKTVTPIGFQGLVVEALRDLREEKDLEIALLQAEMHAREKFIAELLERVTALEAQDTTVSNKEQTERRMSQP